MGTDFRIIKDNTVGEFYSLLDDAIFANSNIGTNACFFIDLGRVFYQNIASDIFVFGKQLRFSFSDKIQIQGVSLNEILGLANIHPEPLQQKAV